MRQTILDTFDRERVRTGLTAGIATVGRPTGVGGKKMSPRRAKMTSKEVDHIKTRAGIKAGGPGSGRHSGSYNMKDAKTADKELSKLGYKYSKTSRGGNTFSQDTFKHSSGAKATHDGLGKIILQNAPEEHHKYLTKIKK